ncbi:hypothetical protein ACC736_38200, partial [Rhizobium ruizarguesonis]
SSFDDVSLLSAHGSYKASRFVNDCINEVINRHCREKWFLYVDADDDVTRLLETAAQQVIANLPSLERPAQAGFHIMRDTGGGSPIT